MNDEYKNNYDDDNEVVDSIPEGTKHLGDDDNIQEYEYNNKDFCNGKTKIIIESGPASIVTKIALVLSLLSVIFCLFPKFAFIAALLGAGIALLSIAYNLNGKIIAAFAIFLSILGGIFAACSTVIWAILYAIIGLFS